MTEYIEASSTQFIDSILKGLARVRIERKGWFDSEEERIEVESLVFKIAESVRPFLLASIRIPDKFKEIPLETDIIEKDLRSVFDNIKKDGFYPSPYSPIPEVGDQYTEFAAFCLEFCDLVYTYSKESNPKLSVRAKSTGKRALDFLLDTKNYHSDEKGCRWAGTNSYSREKKIKEYYTDVYFTSRMFT